VKNLTEKKCSKCGETKELDKFHNKKGGRLGRSACCKICVSKKLKEKTKANNPNYKPKIIREKEELQEGERRCLCCLEVKNKIDFCKRGDGTNGLKSRCKKCENEISRNRYIKNKDAVLKKQRVDYEKNKAKKLKSCSMYYEENKIEIREKHKKNYQKNKEERNKKSRAHYLDNKDWYKNWRKENKALLYSNASERRALEQRASPNNIPIEEKRDIRNLFKESNYDIHVDHIIPIKGKLPDGKRVLGAHRLSNLQLLSREENMKKLNNITYEDLSKSVEGRDYIFVPNDYHKCPSKYPFIGFDVI